MSKEVEEEHKRHQEVIDAEKTWRAKQKQLRNEPAQPEKEEIGSKNNSGDAASMSMRGADNRFGRMYTCGTSKCCVLFGKCDPTRCVHIVEPQGGAGDLREMKNGIKLHTVTVHYEDERGNKMTHRETHCHTGLDTCDHRSCVHIHLPKSILRLKEATY